MKENFTPDQQVENLSTSLTPETIQNLERLREFFQSRLENLGEIPNREEMDIRMSVGYKGPKFSQPSELKQRAQEVNDWVNSLD